MTPFRPASQRSRDRRGLPGIAAAIVSISLCAPLAASAQRSVGTIIGNVKGSVERGSNELRVVLREASSGTVVIEAVPESNGSFVLRDVPYAHYWLDLMLGDAMLHQMPVTVSSGVPVVVSLDSLPRYTTGPITVEARRNGINPDRITSSTLYTAETIRDLPTTSPEHGIEAILLNTPGVVPDEDGRLHVRGEDAQLQYVIDGIPVTANLTRVYSSLFSAGLIKSVDIQTGGLPAEYGKATAAVLAVNTKSGFDRPLFGHAEATVGSFNGKEYSGEIGGTIGGRVGLYVAASRSNSDHYLDPIAPGDPLHDYGEASHLFAKANVVLSNTVDLNILGSYNKSLYYVPNGVANSPQDQRQDLDDYLAGARVNATIGDDAVLSVLGYTRHARARVASGGLRQITSAADSAKAVAENEKFFIGAERVNDATGGQVELSSRTRWFDHDNNVKFGAGGERYPLSEFFTFAVTNPNLSDSLQAGGDSRYQPYDITKGGHPFLVDREMTGRSYFAYAQDAITLDRWHLSAGVRFDMFDLLEREIGISPRIGASYEISDDLVLRGSYNHMVMQPPVENILVSSSEQARQLTGAEQGTTPINVEAERSHNLEIGAAYRLNDYVSLDLVGYGKLIDNFIVKVELGNSGIIFPVNLKQGLVAGGELRADLRDWNNLSGFLSISGGAALGMKPEDGSSPIAAGLILGEEGKNYSHPFAGEDIFPTEHNQVLTSAMGLTYRLAVGFFATLGGRFDFGLPFDLTDSQGNGLDVEQSRAELRRRGYTDDVIDLLNLESEEPGSPDKSVAPHAIFDIAAGFDLQPLTGIRARVTGTVTNVFDTPYLYKFESSFGGTHFGQPRMFSVQVEAGL
jgi:outer membrane cobalamin receptor